MPKLSRKEAIELMRSTRRESDDFVNLTEWCKRYGKKWEDFRNEKNAYLKNIAKRLNSGGARLKPMSSKGLNSGKPYYSDGRGKNAQTFGHPLVFLELIRWLDPDIAVFANEVFQKYIEGDSDLGLEIILRDHNKERQDRAKHRLKVADANKQAAALAHKHGTPVHAIHNDRYRGLYRQTATQLRNDVENHGIELRKDETPLNAMSTYDLSLNELANMMALQCDDPNAVFSVADGLRELHEQKVGKPLKPQWEEKRMSPASARTVLNGQLSFPV